MNLSVEKVREVIKISQDPVSLETPIGEEDDSHLGDFLKDESSLSPEEYTENGKNVASVVVAVTRNYKNVDGVYETDFIKCVLWNAIAESATDYCHKGDVIGIKGRLQSNEYDDENGKRHYVTEVIAERVTFLSSKPKEEQEEKVVKNEVKKSSNKKKAE